MSQFPETVQVVVFDQDFPFGGVQIIGVCDNPIQVSLHGGVSRNGAGGIFSGISGSSIVTSIFGRGGDVIALPGDYAEFYQPLGYNASQSASTPLVNGQAHVDVAFEIQQTDADWVFLACSVFNTVDPNPLNIWPGIITSKTITGFRVQLNGLPDSGNYYLHWAISGVSITPVPATSYLLSGPATGGISTPATFTVHLPTGTTIAGSVTVTPSDGGGGGAFTPTSVVLNADNRSRTFTYTPVSYGAKTISATNTGGLTDPASLTFTCLVDTYTLSGPSSGANGVASTNFTVALPVGGVVTGTVTVTPSSGGGGGTFTPTTVGLTTAAPSATFTYTPASVGAKTISVTNNGGLTNPGNLTYTSTSSGVSDTFTDTDNTPLPSHTMDSGSGWTRFEGTGTNQMKVFSNAAQSFFDAGSAYAYWTESGLSDCTVSFKAIFGVADGFHYCVLVFRYVDASNYWVLQVAGGGASNVTLIKKVAGADTTMATGTLAITGLSQYNFSVTLSGTSISGNAGGTVVSTTDAFNQTATKHGIRCYEGGGASPNYFDLFAVTP